MPVPTDINSLSTTPSANYPIGSADSPSVLDDHQRQAYAHIATLRDSLSTGLAAKAPIASPTFTGTVGGITGAMVVNTPAGNIAAATVQAAINELDTEKVPLNGTGATGTWPISISGDATNATNATNADTVDGYHASSFVQTVNGVYPSGGNVDVVGGFESTTTMLFAQTAAPTGWTKSTAHNDKALRVVSGTAGSGGSVAFSALFGRTVTDTSTLSVAQLAAHTHTVAKLNTGSGSTSTINSTSLADTTTNVATSSTGSGSTHFHGIDMRVRYLDVIVATKD